MFFGCTSIKRGKEVDGEREGGMGRGEKEGGKRRERKVSSLR